MFEKARNCGPSRRHGPDSVRRASISTALATSTARTGVPRRAGVRVAAWRYRRSASRISSEGVVPSELRAARLGLDVCRELGGEHSEQPQRLCLCARVPERLRQHGDPGLLSVVTASQKEIT